MASSLPTPEDPRVLILHTNNAPISAISPQSGFTCVALGDDSAVAALSLYTQSEASLSTTTMTTTARNDDDTSAAAAVATTPDQGEEESASGPTGCQLLQIQCCSPKHASWFIGESIVSNGSLYLGTPLDPLFFLIPALRKSRRITAGPGANSDRKAGLFCSEQDVLSYCDPVVVAPALARSPPGAMARSLAAVCEVREAGGEKYYRLCEARLEAWTELKLVRIEEALSQAQPECGREKAGASANNKRSMAVNILLEYLDFQPSRFGGQESAFQAERESEHSALRKEEEALGANAYCDDDDEYDELIRSAPKREKLEGLEQKSQVDHTQRNPSQHKHGSALTAKTGVKKQDELRMKASRGSKAITSFFTKKA